MVEPQGLMTYPGIGQIISGSLTLAHGITPSVAQLTFAPQGEQPELQGTLSISYGDLRLDFNGCRLMTQSFSYDGQGYLISCSIADRRWYWKDHSITGAYNLRFPDCSLNITTQKSAKELLQLCLDALGEGKSDLSAVPNLILPEVHWDYTAAAAALDEVAAQAGCRVILGLDDTIHVAPAGVGAELPEGSLEAIGKSESPPPIPDAFLYVAGPSRYQIDVLLEAVGVDLDGTVKPIDKLSFIPVTKGGKKTWTREDPKGFLGVDNKTKARDLALKYMYRWYRIPPAPLGFDGKPLQIAGWDGKVDSRLQILPIEDEQCETTLDPLEIIVQPGQGPEVKAVPKNKRALVWGHFAEKKQNLAINVDFSKDPAGSQVPLWSEPGAEYKGSYQIDRNEGIVKFDEQVYLFSAIDIGGLVSRAAYPAILCLRVACGIKPPDTRTPKRYTKEKRLAGNNLTQHILFHPESRATYWPELSPGTNTPAGVHSTVDETVLANVPPLKNEADYYIDAAILSYQTPSPQEATYAGIMPITPDGAIQSVSWSVGLSGATTKASRNCELTSVVVSFAEKRMLSQLNELRLRGKTLLWPTVWNAADRVGK